MADCRLSADLRVLYPIDLSETFPKDYIFESQKVRAGKGGF